MPRFKQPARPRDANAREELHKKAKLNCFPQDMLRLREGGAMNLLDEIEHGDLATPLGGCRMHDLVSSDYSCMGTSAPAPNKCLLLIFE